MSETNERREIVADIVVEYRADMDAVDRGDLPLPTTGFVRILLDRIEAAWKHEKASIEADALAVGGVVEAAHELSKRRPELGGKLGQFGNAAATGEKPEVADAVIAEMRERAKFLRDARELDIHNSVIVLGCYLDETLANLADRLEAALKQEHAAFDCERAWIAELAAKEEAARHKPAWQALARIGDAIQQKMESSPCSVTEHERAIMNLCMRTFAEQSHRQQLFNEDKVRESLAEIAKIADDWERHSNTKAGALDSIYELANAALSALKGGKEC